MKKILITLMLIAGAVSAYAQSSAGVVYEKEFHLFDFSLNARRLEFGLNFGQAGSFTPYARFGMGACALVNGIYLDYLEANPQHKYNHEVTDTKWDDTVAFCINAGYQIPILSWLRIMPVLGYAQTNEGVTDGSSLHLSADEDNTTWYHEYKVTPGTRTHYFNYGGGLSIQPCKWFSVNLIATRYALYGGIGIDLLSFVKTRG